MEDLFEMFELIAEEGPIMEAIKDQLGEIKTLNDSEAEIITKTMTSLDSELKKEECESIADCSERQAKHYFTIAQLYLKRANIRKRMKEVFN